MQTKITKLLGIKYPIIQGGMQWVGTPELASAVSNAGGLGIVTALINPSPEEALKEIKRALDMTDRPIGVNLTILPTLKPVPYREYAAAIAESGVKIVETAGKNPEEVMPVFKDAGIKVIHKCTSIHHAKKAEELGCSAVSIDGFECAGHPGEDDIPGLILLPRAKDELKLPIIASGGFGDGRGLAAALCLGAEAINMGTRFLATKEAPVHENVKKALVNADEKQTKLIFRTLHNTARIYKNKIAEQVVEMEKRNASIDELAPLVSGMRGKKVFETGDLDYGVWTAGMVAGIIKDIPSVEELVKRIVDEAEDIISKRLIKIIGA
jgi:nitronate monooxygenase